MSDAIKLVAVGDIMLGDHPVTFGHGVKSMIEKSGGESPFAKVSGLLREGDIVFGNVEAVLSDQGVVRGRLVSEEFRASPRFGSMLAAAGFNVVGFSNNHCMEHGDAAFWDTVQVLRGNGMQVAGLLDSSGLCSPVKMSINGLEVMVLSYSLCPENYHKGPSVPYAHQQNFDKVLSEAASFRGQADILILSLHWGYEYMDYPSPKQVKLAHRLIDEAEVNIIIGHHPHVLQAVERYRKAVIIYSLGNFVFDMWQRPTRDSMAFQATLSKEGRIDYNLIPLWINDKRQPETLIGTEREKAFFNQVSKLQMLLDKQCLTHTHDLANQDVLDGLESGYIKLARKKEVSHRVSSYLYFLRNIYRYTPAIISQSLLRSLHRRFESQELR
ncbi:MAG: CapA family protein [Nitrospira sp.]|nr:CapA family protein [Nitrospira sp.]